MWFLSRSLMAKFVFFFLSFSQNVASPFSRAVVASFSSLLPAGSVADAVDT